MQRAGVIAMEIMTIVGRDGRQPQLLADVDQRLIERAVQFVVLQFEVVAILEGARVPLGGLASLVEFVSSQIARDFAGEASRQNNQTLVAFGEDLLVDARLVIEPFLVRRAEQAA
jgi:hypothetical protein